MKMGTKIRASNTYFIIFLFIIFNFNIQGFKVASLLGYKDLAVKTSTPHNLIHKLNLTQIAGLGSWCFVGIPYGEEVAEFVTGGET